MTVFEYAEVVALLNENLYQREERFIRLLDLPEKGPHRRVNH